MDDENDREIITNKAEIKWRKTKTYIIIELVD